jgi:ADP-heptose:LPS heptosyltransferase
MPLGKDPPSQERTPAGRSPDAAARPPLALHFDRVLRSLLSGSSLLSEPNALVTVPQRILAVKVHGMGDAVMVRSIIGHLFRRHSNLEIGVLVGPATREVMSLGTTFTIHEYQQRTLSVRSGLAMLREIRGRRYAAILNFEQGSLAGTAFLRATGIPVRIGFVPITGEAKAPFLTHPIRLRDEDSMWQSFQRLLRIVDPQCPELRSTQALPVSIETDRWIRNWMDERALDGHRWVALHLGPVPSFRRWPIERFVNLAERLLAKNSEVVIALTGQSSEKPLIDEFKRHFSGLAIDGTGLGTLERTAALLRLCDLVVSNDTGVMHLAAAMGAPTVGIMGPEVPRRYAPVGRCATAIYKTAATCSPCIDIYRLRVPLSCSNSQQSRCLLDVTVDAVLNAAKSQVEEGWLN